MFLACVLYSHTAPCTRIFDHIAQDQETYRVTLKTLMGGRGLLAADQTNDYMYIYTHICMTIYIYTHIYIHICIYSC